LKSQLEDIFIAVRISLLLLWDTFWKPLYIWFLRSWLIWLGSMRHSPLFDLQHSEVSASSCLDIS